jgi:hypothetical protein
MRSFSRHLVLLFLVPIFVACGGEQEENAAVLGSGDIRWASFPVNIQVDKALLDQPGASEDLEDAILFWENRAGRTLFRVMDEWREPSPPYQGSAENPDEILANAIFLQNPWPFSPSIAGKTFVHSEHNRIRAAVILINVDTPLCAEGCLNNHSATSRRKLLAHELGHFLGFSHTQDRLDIMFPEIQPNGELESMNVNGALLQKLTQ